MSNPTLELAKKRTGKFIAAIDPVELACRLLESAAGMKRPAGATAMQAFLSLEQEDQDRWLRCANAAMEYWRERIADLRSAN